MPIYLYSMVIPQTWVDVFKARHDQNTQVDICMFVLSGDNVVK